jgi:hypothetical protein
VDERTGCWIWNINPHAKETVSWSGGCTASGPATGRGVAEWKFDGGSSRYEGALKLGRASGKGVYTWANGSRYQGDWKDGNRTGQGTIVWFTGNRYEGGWENGKRSGKGTMTFTSGNTYTGEWSNDLPNGQGEAVIKGTRYAGTWLMGCYNQDGKTAWIVANADDCK